MTRLVTILVAAAMIPPLSACGGRTAAWHAQGELPEREMMLLDEAARLTAEGDEFWAQRPDPERMTDAIVRWEQAVSIDPLAHGVHARISRAYRQLMLQLDPEESEARVEKAEAGILSAEMALMTLSPEFGERMHRGADLAEGMEVLGSEAADPLFLYAVNLESWLEHQSRFVQARYRGWVDLVLERVVDLDESAVNAGVHRRGINRNLAAGELELARYHMERVIELVPDFLPARVLLTEKVAIPAGDRALFEEQMNYVLSAEDHALPGCVPENLQAKAEARNLLARMDEFFPPVIEPVPEEPAPVDEPAEPGAYEDASTVDVFVPGADAAPAEEAAEEDSEPSTEPAPADEPTQSEEPTPLDEPVFADE